MKGGMKRWFVLFLAAVCLASTAKAQSIELISRAFTTTTGSANGDSMGGIYSPDGKFILFSSTAPDLVNVPNKGQSSLYLLNTTNNAIQVVSVAPNGDLGSGTSVAGGMSSDNRFVVFGSSSGNLVAGDTNGVSDIFLRELTADTTTLVSHNSAGASGNAVSEFPQISPDGEWVVFQSDASDLIANDTNGLRDLFAWKRSDNSVRLLSAGANGNTVSAEVTDASLSADGKFVLFTASGASLVQANRTSNSDIYLYDLQNGTTRWISSVVTNLAGLTNASNANAVMSSDNRFVFMLATPPPPTTSLSSLVRVDLNDNSVILIATNIARDASIETVGPSISDDGQFAAFVRGTNVFYWSAAIGATVQVDVSASGLQDAPSDSPVISHDGKKVAFLSTSSDLVAGVIGGDTQIYVRDMVAGKTYLITRSTSGDPTTGNVFTAGVFSPDDSTLLFDSQSDELVDADANADYDVFTWNAATDRIALVSTTRSATPSLTANGTSNIGQGSISADGRLTAFQSLAQLTANDTNISYDAYVFDRVLKTNILVSAGPNGLSSSNNPISLPKISADGTKVAFESATRGLAGPDDNRAGTSVYVRDLQSGTLTNISGANVGNLSLKQISADGRYVFFTTLVGGITSQLHRYDMVAQTDLLETTASGPFAFLAASADGSRVAYFANGLYFRDFSQPARILIFSSSVIPTTLLSADGSTLAYFVKPNLIVTNIVTGETSSYGPIPTPTTASMSADGRIIAYAFRPQAIGAISDVWFLDRVTGRTNLVSRSSGSVGGNDSSSAPVVSADGRFIAFESWASNLVPDDNNQQKDVFVYDRFTDRLTFVSHAIGSASSANSGSFNPQFAPAGPLLLFISGSSDLVDGDLNDDIDVFAARLDTTVQSGDSDGDGLDDAWERAAFSTLDFGPADDPDGDGATNAQEFAAGTNPSDAASVFALHVNSTSQLGFKTAPGRTYQLEFRGSVDAGAWQPVGNTIVGDGNNASVPISNPTAQGFYRVRIVQ